MPSQYYMFFNDKENSMEICDETGNVQFQSTIGDSMISFLELDLSSFNKCSNLLVDYFEDDYNTEIENKIIKTYPKTYSELIKGSKYLTENPLEDNVMYFIGRNIDIENISDIYEHPYVQYSESYQYGHVADPDIFLRYDYNLQGIQDCYKKILEFCFEIEYNDNLNSLSAFERFYLFQIREGFNYFYSQNLKYKQITLPYLKHKVHESIKKNDINDTVIDYIKAIKPYQLPALLCGTPKDLIVYEFHHMLNLNIKMKKCKNCGKYFILKGDYNTDYCDRILPGEKFTCKKLAAIKARKEKLSSNPILREYEKAYKRNYARRTNHKMDAKEFLSWVDEASAKRDVASEQYEKKQDVQIIKDFKKYLGNK